MRTWLRRKFSSVWPKKNCRYSARECRRVSGHILHVGVHVKSPADQDKFYKDILGFRFLWQGGPRDDRLDWISYLTAGGDNWVEYMVQHEGPPTPRQLGVWHHVCLGALDIQAVYKTVMDCGYTPPKSWSANRSRNPLAQRTWILTSNDNHKA